MIGRDGIYEVSDVPALLKRFNDSKGSYYPALLQARAALEAAIEGMMASADAETRALTAAERRSFDSWAMQMRSVGQQIAAYNERRKAELAATMHEAPHQAH